MIDFATWRWPSMRIGEQEKGEYKPSEGMIGEKKLTGEEEKSSISLQNSRFVTVPSLFYCSL